LADRIPRLSKSLYYDLVMKEIWKEPFLITLPKKLEERLKKESKKFGVSEEELILEALSKILDEPLDPETRLEMHLKLSEKYLKDAEGFLDKGDYVQASEKAWGAASQMVKALAARRGVELRSHGELHKEVIELT